MKENKWQWSGSEKEFLELIRWAIIFRMLSTEKKSGWMKIAFNKDKIDIGRRDAKDRAEYYQFNTQSTDRKSI